MFLHLTEGVVMAVLAGIFTGTDQKIFFVVFGALATISPDIDFIIFLYRRRWKIDEFVHEHRDILHHPAQIVLIGGIIVWFLFGFDFCLLWIFAILVHFIHDSIFKGWGIRWIPFDRRYFILAKYSPKRIISDLDEQRKIAIQYGDPKWFKKQTRANKKIIHEFVFFLAASVLALCWILF